MEKVTPGQSQPLHTRWVRVSSVLPRERKCTLKHIEPGVGRQNHTAPLPHEHARRERGSRWGVDAWPKPALAREFATRHQGRERPRESPRWAVTPPPPAPLLPHTQTAPLYHPRTCKEGKGGGRWGVDTLTKPALARELASSCLGSERTPQVRR